MTGELAVPANETPRVTNFGITLITPLKWWGPASLKLQFTVTRMLPSLTRLAPFRSVYFSQWSILTGFDNGHPRIKERLSKSYLLWEVAYSATKDPYIESFVAGISRQINLLWGSSIGFPGTASVHELSEYIDDFAWPIDHTYWAYPEASVRIVDSALRISREHDFLVKAAQSSAASQFEVTYDGFLRRRGRDL